MGHPRDAENGCRLRLPWACGSTRNDYPMLGVPEVKFTPWNGENKDVIDVSETLS